MKGLKTIVANLANRINQPHYLEVELAKVFEAGVNYGMEQSKLNWKSASQPPELEEILSKVLKKLEKLEKGKKYNLEIYLADIVYLSNDAEIYYCNNNNHKALKSGLLEIIAMSLLVLKKSK